MGPDLTLGAVKNQCIIKDALMVHGRLVHTYSGPLQWPRSSFWGFLTVEVVCGVQEFVAFGGTWDDYGEASCRGRLFGDFERSRVSEFKKIAVVRTVILGCDSAHVRMLLMRIIRLHKSVVRFSATS